MLNILLAIILDAFEKNQDNRKQIDKPFIQLITGKAIIKPASQCYKKICCCCSRKSKKNLVEENFGINKLNSEEASNKLETNKCGGKAPNGLSVKFLESQYAENEYHAERRKSMEKGMVVDGIVMEDILSGIKINRAKMTEEIEKIVGKDNGKLVEETTDLFFTAYARNNKERTEYEMQLQQLQSHVTCSLQATNDKIDMIIKHLKMGVGKED